MKSESHNNYRFIAYVLRITECKQLKFDRNIMLNKSYCTNVLCLCEKKLKGKIHCSPELTESADNYQNGYTPLVQNFRFNDWLSDFLHIKFNG